MGNRKKRITADPVLRVELALCEKYGLPHSEFLSWSEMDRAKAVEYAKWKASKCPTCHTSPEDWEKDGNAFIADTHFCEGCRRLSEMESQLSERKPPAGVSVVLRSKAEYLAVEKQRESRKKH